MYFSLSEIRLFAGNFAPQKWAFCNGQSLNLKDNLTLYYLLGTTFGGDAQSNFGVPNLADRDGGNGGKVHHIMCTTGSWPASMDGFIGVIRLFGGLTPPTGWLPCDGRVLPVSQSDGNSLRLLAVLGTAYGGNGTTSVGLPRLNPHPQAVTIGTVALPQYLICVEGQLASQAGQSGGQNARTEDLYAEVLAFAGNYLPESMMPAQGGFLPISQNQALFSLLGSNFTAHPNLNTFQVPNLAPLQALNGPPIPFLLATQGIFPNSASAP